MARINLLETRTTQFGDLISNGKIYRVPPFQRDYAWQEENWEDLWQDILALHTNPDTSHYMGALVLQSSNTSDKEFTIIDGQQRLATLSIIAIAVIDKLQELVDRGEDKEANQDRQDILRRNTVVSSLNPNELEILYNKVAIAITKGEITNPKQVFTQLHSSYVSDEKFAQDFALLLIPTRGKKKELVRYILGKLEQDASGRQDLRNDGFSIEHILLESPTEAWCKNFTDTALLRFGCKQYNQLQINNLKC